MATKKGPQNVADVTATDTTTADTTAKDPLADVIAATIRAGFNDRAALAQDLLSQSQAKVSELADSLAKIETAGVNGAMLKVAQDALASEQDLLAVRQERVAVLEDADEVAHRIDAGIAFVRSLADPDATVKQPKAAGGSTAPRAAKVPFKAWIDGKAVTAASALKSFGLLAFYKIRDPKGTYPVESMYREFRDQASVDLENNPAPGTYEATCNGKTVKIEILAPETATA